MLTKEHILEMLQNNKAAIKAFGVKRIGLFGSYLQGIQNSESDIDILVEFKTGQKSFDHYMDLKFFLEKLFGCKVDLIIKESIKPDLKDRILKSVEYASRL